jgi:phospholipid/cholesterol/gamma-HCH transport system substrate-binding protein
MKEHTYETVAGIFVFLGLAALVYMAVTFGEVGLFNKNYYSLTADFNKVSGLRVGNPVEMFGIEIGKVSGCSIDQDDQLATVEMKIKKDITIYSDAIASIKTAGLIGDKYISIMPGGAGDALKPGDNIFDTESPSDLSELIGKYAFGNVSGKKEEK